MNIFRYPVFLAVALLFSSASADAQGTIKPKTPPTPKVITSSTASSPGDVRSGADKVSIQIKNVTKFIYALGGIASGIEALDQDPRANQAAKEKNAANKKAVMQTIRNLRAGLAALEVEFRTKTTLKKFLPQIQGITDLVAQTESLASTGRFSESGKPLLLVVEKLSDTLAAMP